MEDMENKAQQQPEAELKTYTQEEVDKIVEGRIGRERAKYGDYEELKAKATKYEELENANKSELQKAQEKAAEFEGKAAELTKKLNDMEKEKSIREMREKVAAEKKLPADLLTGETEEACTAQADAILKFAAGNGYPVVKDGGEPNKVNKISTKEQFKQWADKQL